MAGCKRDHLTLCWRSLGVKRNSWFLSLLGTCTLIIAWEFCTRMKGPLLWWHVYDGRFSMYNHCKMFHEIQFQVMLHPKEGVSAMVAYVYGEFSIYNYCKMFHEIQLKAMLFNSSDGLQFWHLPRLIFFHSW
jgi:hypothetical protein